MNYKNDLTTQDQNTSPGDVVRFDFMRSSLYELLTNGKLKVTFNKINGEERTMLCTLSEQYLPKQEVIESKRRVNPDVMSVWDLEKNEWRSFRLDKVIGYYEYADS